MTPNKIEIYQVEVNHVLNESSLLQYSTFYKRRNSNGLKEKILYLVRILSDEFIEIFPFLFYFFMPLTFVDVRNNRLMKNV